MILDYYAIHFDIDIKYKVFLRFICMAFPIKHF